MRKNLGFGALLLAAAIFASDGVLVTVLGNSFGYFSVSALRFGMALIIISLIIIYKQLSIRVSRKTMIPLTVFSLSYLGAFLIFSIGILQASKVSNVIFAMLCGALLTTLIYGTFVLQEKMNKWKSSSIVLAIMGMGFISYPFNYDVSLILGLGGGLLFGLANSYRKVLGGVKYEVIVFYQSLLASILAILAVLIVGESVLGIYDVSNFLLALGYGLSTVATGLLVTYGFNHFPVNIGQVVLTTELFFALLLNFIFLNEVPITLEIVGAGLIFVATVTSKFSD